MSISHHIYQLTGANPIGARAKTGVRYGALLRIVHDDGAVGYADLHPWHELGDLTLEGQLADLKAGKGTQLTRAALGFARIDADARAQKRSLWAGLVVPRSHFLVANMRQDAASALELPLAQGFTRFKVKIGKDLNAEKMWLNEACAVLASAAKYTAEKPALRLDANETLTPLQFAQVWNEAKTLRDWVDFVEDPCVFEAETWGRLSAQTGASLAVDRELDDALLSHFSGVYVVKPVRWGAIWPNLQGNRGVVTTYLDHPLGQVCAAWVAAQYAPQETHGLASHRVYAENEFSAGLGWGGPVLELPGGYGFGWDDLLAKLDWKPLP